ncbi:MAG: hybrid sensor histidine kinase/response regulator [Anaerolineae bacterium]|nr:hybrid sensor histidine kinase/response regulator [Anaerolineae bacterium]
MTIGPATLASLVVSPMLSICGAALALLVLWHNARRPSNLCYALGMVTLSLYGLANTVFTVAQPLALDPDPLRKSVTSLYVLSVTLLFGFMLSFAEIPARLQRAQMALIVLVAALGLILVWQGAIFKRFEAYDAYSYEYRFTSTGVLGAGLAALCMISVIAAVYRQRNARARALAWPLAAMTAGVAAFAALPVTRTYSLNALMLTAAAIMLGRLVIIFQVFQPLTDLNAALAAKNDELRRATRLKSQFLATMSHELRTPLNSIIGYTDLVLLGTYGDLNALQQDRLQKVVRNGRRLLELINDVLDLSRIEAGRLALTITRVPTVALLDELLAAHAEAAQAKGLALVRGYAALPDLAVDRGRAYQALDNLLQNAITFTERGAVIVRGYFDSIRDQVVLCVADSGPGIEPAQQERIYRAFYQPDGTLTHHEDGTGLGLAIAQRLVALHGGNLWFATTPGKGTAFYVALPAAPGTPVPPPILTPGRRTSGPLVVLMDGDGDRLAARRRALERAKCRAFGAQSASDGLRLICEQHPALVVLDFGLAELGAAYLVRSLRHDPALGGMPILVIAAPEVAGQARAAGASSVLISPVTPGAVSAEAVRLLADRALEEGAS